MWIAQPETKDADLVVTLASAPGERIKRFNDRIARLKAADSRYFTSIKDVRDEQATEQSSP